MKLAGKTFGFHIHYPNLTYNFLYSYKNVDVVAKVENNLATSQKEEMIASPTVSGTVAVVGSLDDSLSEANKVDVNEEGVGNNVAVATVDNNVATSKNEGLNAAPTVAGEVEHLGSLSNTFSKDNKDDVKAEGVGVPFVVSTGNKQVKNCVNS